MSTLTKYPPTAADLLTLLRAEKAKRDEVSEAEEDARELEELKLDSELSSQGLKRGKDYEIANTPFGVFGVKRPDPQGFKAWEKATSATPVDTDRLAGVLKNYILPPGPKQNEFHLAA